MAERQPFKLGVGGSNPPGLTLRSAQGKLVYSERSEEAPSSSGLGRLAFIQKIASSILAGVTLPSIQMTIKELERLIPDTLKPPIMTRSLEEFLETLKAQGAVWVTATPGRKTLLETESEGVGVDGAQYEYNITFTAKDRRGRKIELYYPCSEKFLDNPDYINAQGGRFGARRLTEELEERYLLTTFVTADALLRQIEEKLPGCQTALQDADKVFSDEDYAELRLRAEKEHIRPWSQEGN